MTPPDMPSPQARFATALIALCAALGLVAGFWAVHGRTGSVPGAIWSMLAYFTNLTGLVVMGLFAWPALGGALFADRRRGSWLVAGAALATLLVGLVQRLLLQGLRIQQGGDLVADILLHQVVPVLVPLFWLVFVPKGYLRRRDPLLWACYPLAYLACALMRGVREGHYPYPFLDIGTIGGVAVLAYTAAITAAFLTVGWGIVALDGGLARRRAA
jgi:hypothetical protein